MKRGAHGPVDLRQEQKARPLWDAWWAARTPELERIEVPALICASFSDHSLHSRGSFEAFRRISSVQKWVYTHRGGKWAEYYSPEALAFQARFFDCFLKGEENGMRDAPRVRLEVHETGEAIHQVCAEAAWPLPRTEWTRLFLHADGTLGDTTAGDAAEVRFDARKGRASFTWTAPADVALTGPMKLRLHVETRDVDDVYLFAGVSKLRNGREVGFEGSYGFPYDLVTKGWLKASHRRLDEAHSGTWRLVHRHEVAEPLRPGEIVPLEIELLSSSTLFRRGDVLWLDVQGRWFFPRDPFRGQFPATYKPSPPGTAVLHCGGAFDVHLLVPLIPATP